MNLGRDLSSPMQGEDVPLLQGALQQLGYVASGTPAENIEGEGRSIKRTSMRSLVWRTHPSGFPEQ
jgi:hypothetical protein